MARARASWDVTRPAPNDNSSCELCCAGAVELRNTLQDSFSVNLPATMALDYPTAAAIAAHIASLLPLPVPARAVTKAAPVSQQPRPGGQLRGPVPIAMRRQQDAPVTTVMVGLSARFPGPVLDAADFWNNINASLDLPEEASAVRCRQDIVPMIPQQTEHGHRMPGHQLHRRARILVASGANAQGEPICPVVPLMPCAFPSLQVPLERWDIERLYSPHLAAGKMYTRLGAWLTAIDQFDGAMFGMNHSEAVATDPQVCDVPLNLPLLQPVPCAQNRDHMPGKQMCSRQPLTTYGMRDPCSFTLLLSWK